VNCKIHPEVPESYPCMRCAREMALGSARAEVPVDEVCEAAEHPFHRMEQMTTGINYPVCRCGTRADFTDDEVFRGRLEQAIFIHDAPKFKFTETMV